LPSKPQTFCPWKDLLHNLVKISQCA
jgi:hypothetical protein